MELIEVNSKNSEKEFITIPYTIYKNDPNCIAPLEKDIRAIFDPAQNPALEGNEVKRWILKNNGNVIGRVAAYINYKGLENMEYPVGSLGFFECIDDINAAFMLFDACKTWLESKGMKGMDGPVNFGERDKFWGLLVETTSPPMYQEAYNLPYYKTFFEEYGFHVYFEQYTYLITKKTYTPDRLVRVAKLIERKPGYHFEHLNFKELDRFMDDFVYIYNAAWQKFENFKPVKKEEILAIFKDLKPVMVKEYVWFAYVNNEPSGFFVVLPDFNLIFKHLHGKFNLWSKLKFLIIKNFVKVDRLKALVFGIHPNHQGVGLDAVLLYKFFVEVMKNPVHQDCEVAWVGGFNPKMHSLMQTMNAGVAKIHYTYRKLFDETIEFKPYKLGEYKKEI